MDLRKTKLDGIIYSIILQLILHNRNICRYITERFFSTLECHNFVCFEIEMNEMQFFPKFSTNSQNFQRKPFYVKTTTVVLRSLPAPRVANGKNDVIIHKGQKVDLYFDNGLEHTLFHKCKVSSKAMQYHILKVTEVQEYTPLRYYQYVSDFLNTSKIRMICSGFLTYVGKYI